MIKKIMLHIVNLLNEYKKPIDGPKWAIVGMIGKDTQPTTNKILVSLVSIERETAGGIAPTRKYLQREIKEGFPALYMNLNIVFAAVYGGSGEESNYPIGLEYLSKILSFLQSHMNFEFEGVTYTLEIVSPSSQELNNIWSTLGGQYYPSVFCKLRRMVFDSEETLKDIHKIESIEISVEP